MLPIDLPFPFGRLGRPLAVVACGALAVGALAALRHLREARREQGAPRWDADGEVVRYTVVESDGPVPVQERVHVPW